MSIDVGSLVAIDVHVHAERNEGEEQDPVTGEILAAAASDARKTTSGAHSSGMPIACSRRTSAGKSSPASARATSGS